MLLGLTMPDAGEITLLGHPVPEAAREGRIRVGVVPQVDNLDPDFTVRENLLVYGRYFGLTPARGARSACRGCWNSPRSRRAPTARSRSSPAA